MTAAGGRASSAVNGPVAGRGVLGALLHRAPMKVVPPPVSALRSVFPVPSNAVGRTRACGPASHAALTADRGPGCPAAGMRSIVGFGTFCAAHRPVRPCSQKVAGARMEALPRPSRKRRVMHFTNHEWWTLLHGMVFGAVFLLAFGGGLAGLYSLRPGLLTSAG